jgi:alkylhydroperoxidase family enzyme
MTVSRLALMVILTVGLLAPPLVPEAQQAAKVPSSQFAEAQIVELTLRMTLFGFFSRFNDALQIEEEAEALAAAHG